MLQHSNTKQDKQYFIQLQLPVVSSNLSATRKDKCVKDKYLFELQHLHRDYCSNQLQIPHHTQISETFMSQSCPL